MKNKIVLIGICLFLVACNDKTYIHHGIVLDKFFNPANASFVYTVEENGERHMINLNPSAPIWMPGENVEWSENK